MLRFGNLEKKNSCDFTMTVLLYAKYSTAVKMSSVHVIGFKGISGVPEKFERSLGRFLKVSRVFYRN